jgi:CarD family transcriptional regulator
VAKSSVAKSSVAKSSVAKSSVAKSSVAKSSVAKSSVAKPSVAKPSVAKPSAAKSSVAPVAKPSAAESSSVAPVAKPSVAKSSVTKSSVAKSTSHERPKGQGANQGMTSKKATQRQGFKTNEFIVYPAHGVGQIMAIEEQEVAGYKLELFVISFVKDKMTLRVPIAKIATVGMRKLAEPPIVKRALDTLKGRARVKRTMWSRRAQEYEAKINSGNIVSISEVVRDLFRSDSQPEQSYSERQLYEAALDRLAREISAVQRITETEAVKEIEAALAKGPRRGGKAPEGEDPVIEDEAA